MPFEQAASARGVEQLPFELGSQALSSHVCQQAFTETYDKLREELLADPILGKPPIFAKEWFRKVGARSHAQGATPRRLLLTPMLSTRAEPGLQRARRKAEPRHGCV